MRFNPAKEIAKLKRQIATIEAKAAKAAKKKQASDKQKVTALARKLGYKTVKSLFSSLFEDASKPTPTVITATTAKKRKRATLTDADRQAIVADLKLGKLSAVKIAKAHGVSAATVNNLKKAAGLTKSRKPTKKPSAKKTTKRKAAPKKTVKKPVEVEKVEAPAAPAV